MHSNTCFVLLFLLFCYRISSMPASTEAPEILPFSMDTPLSTGRDAALTCSVAKGDTPMTIEWTFESRPITDDMGVLILRAGSRTSFLSIESVGAAHSGEYTCTATNAVGEASHTARLTVKGERCFGTA